MKWTLGHSAKLSADEARQLIERAASVTDTSLPLASGLRAASSDISSTRLRHVMRELADELDAGTSWSELLRKNLSSCPADLRGTIQAALECGHVDEVLGQYVRHRATRRELIRSIRAALAYPCIVLLASGALFIAFGTTFVPEIQALFGEFEFGSRFDHFVWWSSKGTWLLLKAVPIVLLAIVLFRLVAGAARWRRVIHAMPLMGQLWRCLGVMEWSRMLGLYVGYGIPLPQALRWAAHGSRDANIRECGLALAREVEAGGKLSQSAERQQRWPPALVPLLRSGEETHNLSGALTRAATYFEDRVRMRLALVRSVVPPLLFALVATVIVTVCAGAMLVIFSAVGPLFWYNYRSLFRNEVIVPTSLLWPGGFGAMLIWTLAVMKRHRAHRDDSLYPSLELVGWVLVASAPIAYLCSALGHLVWIGLAVSFIVFLVVVQRSRDAQKKTLVHALTMAAEQGIPLGDAARAVSRERSLVGSRRLCELSDLLEAGVPLAESLQQARLRMPTETALAVHVGDAAGQLGPALRESAGMSTASTSLLTDLMARLAYVLLVVGVGVPAVLYGVDSLNPIVAEATAEFGAPQLASVTPWETVKNSLNESSIDWVMILGKLGAFVFVGGLVLCLLCYVRWLSTDLPLLRRLWFPWERVVVLQALSLAVRNRQSIPDALRLFHAHHPKRSIRRRLMIALAVSNAGQGWCDGLLAGGFINASEAAVLRAAERVDNVGWALRELADRAWQRTTFRVRRWLGVVIPMLVMIAGLFVLVVAASQFELLATVLKLGS